MTHGNNLAYEKYVYRQWDMPVYSELKPAFLDLFMQPFYIVGDRTKLGCDLSVSAVPSEHFKDHLVRVSFVQESNHL